MSKLRAFWEKMSEQEQGGVAVAQPAVDDSKPAPAPALEAEESPDSQRLFQAIGRLPSFEGLNKDTLFEEASERLPHVGYEAALQWAVDRCDLRAAIDQLPDVGQDKQVLYRAALPKLEKEGIDAAMRYLRGQIDAKRLQQGLAQLGDVGGVDKTALAKEARRRAEKGGADRALAWAGLLVETKKPDGRVKKDFTEAVFNDDGGGFAQLVKELGDEGAAELHLAFGGRKGLPLVKAVLKDVCKGDVGGLRQLIKALA